MATPPEEHTPVDQRADLLATMNHPIRSHIMCTLVMFPRISASQIAEKMGVPVKSVRRQLKTLVDAGLVGIEDREPVRGVTRFYYVHLRYPWLGREEDSVLSPHERRITDLRAGAMIFEDLKQAVEVSPYGSRPGRMVARVPGLVDQRAWEELSDLQHEALDRMVQITESGHARLVERGVDEGVRVTAALLLVELPDTKSAVGD
jgi:DNA-binding transcriptional ArsR family regulator